VNWLERGDPQTGVPALRASFPLSIEDGKANFEIPCGSIERPTDAGESPALNWVDLTGKALGGELPIGATLLNDCKYGHSVSDDTIRLTLLRSSYDPDPLPELGRHSIRYALVPHSGDLDLGDATHAGHAFNHPIVPVGTTVHEGDLPVEGSALEILAPNVMLSGLKKAEDDDALIIRLYEFEGRQTAARVRLSRVLAEPDSAAVETDLLEQPLDKSTAAMDGDVLTVTIPAFGIATVRVG
jgi:alpha-mannosidase